MKAAFKTSFCKKLYLTIVCFACCIYLNAQELSKEQVQRYEKLIENSDKNTDGSRTREAVKYLRSYYIAQDNQEKLLWLNKKIAEFIPLEGRNKKLVKLLLKLEGISYKLSGKPDKKTSEEINRIINELHEFRWGERDLARALSYVAIGRSYFLLGEYKKALQNSLVDPELFGALDKKFAQAKDSASSPLASLLFLKGNCYQALAGQAQVETDKIKFLGKALVSYYRLINNYRSSAVINDALSRYETCRRQIEKVSTNKITSFERLKNDMLGKQRVLPSNISMLIKTGCYRDAIKILEKECQSQANLASYPLYAACLAKCYAMESRSSDCERLLQKLLKNHKDYPKLPETILQCAAILSQNQHDKSAIAFYKIILSDFKNYKGIGAAALGLARYNLKTIRQGKVNLGKTKITEETIALFDMAEKRLTSNKHKFYPLQGKAEAYFSAGNYAKAADEYGKLLKLKGLDKEQKDEVALNLCKSVYFQAIAANPVSQKLLSSAAAIIKKYKLTDLNGVDYVTDCAESALFLSARINEKQGNKKKAAEILLKLCDLSSNTKRNVNNMISAATLLCEVNDFSKADKVLEKLSSYQSKNITNIRLKIAASLLSKKQNRKAFSMILTALKKGKLSTTQLQWILENCYDAKGEYALKGWYIALKAGIMLDGVDSIKKNPKLCNMIRLKTASAAMKLKNYPTALASVDMVINSDESSLWLPARFIKADILVKWNNISKANQILSETALMASRAGKQALFLKAKYEICKNCLTLGDRSVAKSIIDNLLLPLKSQSSKNSKKMNSLPKIYEAMISLAFDVSEQQDKQQYASLYRKFFPGGKLKSIINYQKSKNK